VFKFFYIINFIFIFPVLIIATPSQAHIGKKDAILSPFKTNVHIKDSSSSIQRINQLAKTKQLKKAIRLCRQVIKENGQTPQLAILYAKLLFWNHQTSLAKKVIEPYKTYAPKLYQQIYITVTLDKLKQMKNPSKKIQFISRLPAFAVNTYDVQWHKIDAYIKQKKLAQALKDTEKLLKKHPNSIELHERKASLLLWTKHYKKSLAQYTLMRKKFNKSYQAQTKMVKNAMVLSQKQKKTKAVPFAAVKKKTAKHTKPSPTIQKKAKHMIGFGYEHAHFSDARYRDRTKYVEITMPIHTYTLYLKLLRTERYGKKDTKIEGELYPVLPKPYWGYLSFSLSNNANFFSKYSIGWHQYYNTGNWQWGLGYVLNHYKDDDISLITGEYTYYFSDLYSFRQTIFYVPDNSSHALLNEMKYKTPSHLEYYVNYTIAHSNEALQDSDLFTGTDSQKIEFGLEYPLSTSTSIGTSISKEWLDGEHQNYMRTTGSIFVRFYW